MYDVIVVGGGPSGSTLGRLLSSKGFDVLIIEKRKFPRYKVCAGAIPFILSELIGDFPFERRFDHLTLKKGNRSWQLKLAAPIVTVKREDFDCYLLNMATDAGAKVVFEMARRVKDNYVHTGNSTYEARIIVGADGPFSIVRKTMGIQYPRWIETVEWELPLRAEDFIVSIGPGAGYTWFWPKKSTVAFGAGGFKDPKKWARKLREELEIEPYGKVYHYRYPIWREGIRIKKNMILIGDAGAFASPITAAGIYSGILSALVAGKMIEQHLKFQKPFSDPYFREFHKNFMPAKILSWFFYYAPGVFIDFGKRSITRYFGLKDCYYKILKSLVGNL